MRKLWFILLCMQTLCAKLSDSVLDDFGPHRVNNYVKKFFDDSYNLGQELLTERTMKVLSGFLPFFLTARHVDERVHTIFYKAETHENRHQPPEWLQTFVDYELMELPAWVCRFFGVAHRDPEVRRAMQVFTTGLIWNLIAKAVIKQTVAQLKLDVGLRPLHPGFDRRWRHYHGIPSGHAILIAYTATFLGLYKGKSYGIPLGLYTGFVMGMRVAGNHHYVSQVVTGAAVGILFGISSYSVFKNITVSKNLAFNVISDGPRRVGFSLAYDF